MIFNKDKIQNIFKTIGSLVSALILLIIGLLLLFFSNVVHYLPSDLENYVNQLFNSEHSYSGIYAVFALLGSMMMIIFDKVNSISENSKMDISKIQSLLENTKNQLENVKNQLQNKNIRILDQKDFNENNGPFDNLHGDFFAFNAPMIWETDPRYAEKALKIHVNRYLDPKFSHAYYLYPIFEYLSAADKKSWANRLHTFFKKLEENKQLNQHSKDKLRFYLPNTHTNQTNNGYCGIGEDSNYTMTFFVGKRNSEDQLIYYHHNTRNFFRTDFSLPYYAFIVHHSDMCSDFIDGCNKLKSNDSSRGKLEEFDLQTFLRKLQEIST